MGKLVIRFCYLVAMLQNNQIGNDFYKITHVMPNVELISFYTWAVSNALLGVFLIKKLYDAYGLLRISLFQNLN